MSGDNSDIILKKKNSYKAKKCLLIKLLIHRVVALKLGHDVLHLLHSGHGTGITFVDSTMIPVCHNLRRYANKVFKGIATDGKGTMGWCHGFKLHLACNDRGEIIAFVLTGANVNDKDPNVFKVLAKRLYGKLFADKGYISQKLFNFLFEDGIQLMTGLRVNMKNKLMPFYDRMMLRKRYNPKLGYSFKK